MADSTSVSVPAKSGAAPRLVLVASTIAWFLGIFDLLTAAALGIPAFSAGTAVGPALLLLGLGLGYCAAGYLLRKRRRSGGVVAMGCAALFIVLALLGGGLPVSLGLVLNALVPLLAAVSWRHLDGGARAPSDSTRGEV